MDEPKLWIVGVAALVLVVSALIWVLRQRSDTTSPAAHHDYRAPEVMDGVGAQAARGSGMTFGSASATDDVVVDQTVPLSRLGGAGWRDGTAVPSDSTTDAYAGESPTWAEDESVGGTDTYEPHVEVDQTIPRSAVGDEDDRERGGHW